MPHPVIRSRINRKWVTVSLDKKKKCLNGTPGRDGSLETHKKPLTEPYSGTLIASPKRVELSSSFSTNDNNNPIIQDPKTWFHNSVEGLSYPVLFSFPGFIHLPFSLLCRTYYRIYSTFPLAWYRTCSLICIISVLVALLAFPSGCCWCYCVIFPTKTYVLRLGTLTKSLGVFANFAVVIKNHYN